MIHNNYSSWAEEVDLDEINEQANKYDISLESIQDACDFLHRSSRRKLKKKHKPVRECWQ